MTKSELCLRCMKCCEVVSFEVTPSATSLEFYKARGAKIKLITSGSPLMIVSFPYPCPHLTPKGCDIYEHRPLACKAFDGSKSLTSRDYCLWKESTDD